MTSFDQFLTLHKRELDKVDEAIDARDGAIARLEAENDGLRKAGQELIEALEQWQRMALAAGKELRDMRAKERDRLRHLGRRAAS